MSLCTRSSMFYTESYDCMTKKYGSAQQYPLHMNHYVHCLEVPALKYYRSHREPLLNTSEREGQ